jgi:PTH2 family peptidyl-tRNA hydrolase
MKRKLSNNPQTGERDKLTFKYKQVILARSDLNMSPGKLAVQVAHGSIGSAEKARREHWEWYTAWLGERQKKVVVKVMDESELRKFQEQAARAELPHELVQDAGLTELPPGTSTVLAIGPAPNELVDKLTRNLPLL